MKPKPKSVSVTSSKEPSLLLTNGALDIMNMHAQLAWRDDRIDATFCQLSMTEGTKVCLSSRLGSMNNSYRSNPFQRVRVGGRGLVATGRRPQQDASLLWPLMPLKTRAYGLAAPSLQRQEAVTESCQFEDGSAGLDSYLVARLWFWLVFWRALRRLLRTINDRMKTETDTASGDTKVSL